MNVKVPIEDALRIDLINRDDEKKICKCHNSQRILKNEERLLFVKVCAL